MNTHYGKLFIFRKILFSSNLIIATRPDETLMQRKGISNQARRKRKLLQFIDTAKIIVKRLIEKSWPCVQSSIKSKNQFLLVLKCITSSKQYYNAGHD